MPSHKRSASVEPTSNEALKRRKPSVEEVVDEDDSKETGRQHGNKIRFGSEELEEWSRFLKGTPEDRPESMFPSSGLVDSDVREEVQNSDDEAPEDIGTAAAGASAIAKQIETARTLQSEREQARKLRQDKAAQLKSQAEKSNKKAKAQAQKTAPNADTSKPYRKSDLPDLLPEDVLAHAAANERENTPDSDEDVTRKIAPPAQKKRLIKFESQPKDVQAGPVQVSVLKDRKKFMAPKSNKASRNIRQNWLSGRTNKKQALQRSKPSRGFLVT